MDNLKYTAPDCYKGREQYTREMKKQPMLDEGGRQLVAKVCERKHIAEATQHSFMRRTYSNAWLKRDMEKRQMYLSDFDQLGARWVKDADEVDTRQNHKGWYTDDFQDATLIGVVLCFTRHGAPDENGDEHHSEYAKQPRKIYMAGTRHSDWDGVTLDFDTTDDPITAARWADSMAEREAESCREEDEKYQAEQKAEELREEIANARVLCLALLRDMKPVRKGLLSVPESVVQALVERVQEYRESIAGWRSELGELT